MAIVLRTDKFQSVWIGGQETKRNKEELGDLDLNS